MKLIGPIFLFICVAVAGAARLDACTKATRRCLRQLPHGRVKKVCGTDGETYKSVCILEQQVCKTGRRIEVASQGGCGSRKQREQIPHPVILMDPQPTTRQPKARGNSGGDSSDESGSSEEGGRSGMNPPPKPTERIRYDRVTVGRRRPAARPTTPSTTTEMPFAIDCPRTCPIVYQPVCGSDGISYRSPCLLRAEACRQRREDLVPDYVGECVPVCGGECEALYDPVCGTNGVTYMSSCNLDQTACRTFDETLTVAYKGECFSSLRARGCQQECEDMIVPVCTNTGMTFKNRCEFERYKCVTLDRAYITRVGACPGTSLECYEDCPHMPYPVCASDGVTYPSICDYTVAHCKDSSVRYQYAGPCLIATPDPCQVECSLDRNPVCGSNRVTYFNRCFLNLSACHEDPTITFVRDGPCDG